MTAITLLDGGVGQEINLRAPDTSHPLWSVKVMFDAPDIVVDVHAAFIRAGARVICLNNYTATPTRMTREGFGEQLTQAHETAIELARRAITVSGEPFGPVQIAGCLPPLVASYVAEVSRDYEQSLAEYRQLVALQNDAVELFMIETMSNITEARAALDAAQESGKPVLLGLTLRDDASCTLRSGEPLADALAELVPKRPDGLLLNCSAPEAMTKAMPLLRDHNIPFGGYANAFTAIEALTPGGTTDALSARADMTAETYTDQVMQWVAMGATIVGGCCEISPQHIAHLHARLSQMHHITALPLRQTD